MIFVTEQHTVCALGLLINTLLETKSQYQVTVFKREQSIPDTKQIVSFVSFCRGSVGSIVRNPQHKNLLIISLVRAYFKSNDQGRNTSSVRYAFVAQMQRSRTTARQFFAEWRFGRPRARVGWGGSFATEARCVRIRRAWFGTPKRPAMRIPACDALQIRMRYLRGCELVIPETLSMHSA